MSEERAVVMTPVLFPWAIFAVTLIAALFDRRTGSIPNALTLGAFVAAPALHALSVARPFALEAAGWSLGAGAICAAAPFALYELGWVGGGDVKLVAAIGALGGMRLGLETAFLAFFAVTSFGLLRLTWRGSLLRTMGGDLRATARRLRGARGLAPDAPTEDSALRFGPFACAGAAMSLLLHAGGLA
jgi:prepilin peptidase CpaA